MSEADTAPPRPARAGRRKRAAFMIAGVQKGGTTTLHAWLDQHPGLAMSRPKELHFFNKDHFFDPGPPPLRRYHAHFAHAAGREDALRGEATPSYLWWPGALERIADYNPAIKLIVSLRCPVERAWSHYRMHVRKGFETADFETALRLEPKRLASPNPDVRRRSSYASRGFYAGQIRKARALFPESQLLFLRSEELRTAPGATLERICDFLGVARFDFDTSRVEQVGEAMGPMPEAARAHLREIFAPDVREVEALLGWDCSDWLASG